MSGSAKARGKRIAAARRQPPLEAEQGEPSSSGAPIPPAPPIQGDGVPPATPRREASDETVRRETSVERRERYDRLYAQVIEKRQLEDMEAMERELAGEQPGFRAEFTSNIPIHGHKRSISASAERQPLRSSFNRPKTPPTFKGKNVEELDKYDVGFRAHFEAAGHRTIGINEINLAATYLEGNPQKRWAKREKPESLDLTWEDYIIYLKNTIIDPANAQAYSSLRLKEARQKRGQTVRDFVEYVEQLERDVPEQTKQQRDAWYLLNCLHPEIRKEVMREHSAITSREQVIAAAQRQEELATQQFDEKPKNKPEGKATETPTPNKVSASGRQAFHRQNSTPKEKGGNVVKCYNCGKLGHISKECRSPQKSGLAPEKDKGQPAKNLKPKP